MDKFVLLKKLNTYLNSTLKWKWLIKQINVELECLTKLLLDVVGPMILLIEVLIFDLLILFDRGTNELFVKYNYTTFAYSLEYYILVSRLLSLLLDVLESLELHVVDLNLLGKLENDRLVQHFSIAVQVMFFLSWT